MKAAATTAAANKETRQDKLDARNHCGQKRDQSYEEDELRSRIPETKLARRRRSPR